MRILQNDMELFCLSQFLLFSPHERLHMYPVYIQIYKMEHIDSYKNIYIKYTHILTFGYVYTQEYINSILLLKLFILIIYHSIINKLYLINKLHLSNKQIQ